MKRSILIAAILLAAVTSQAQMFAQMFGQSWTPASLGPVAWYKFDGNALDSSGTNNGTWGGSEAYTNISGRLAAEFDGSADRVAITGVTTATNKWTISIWVYPVAGAENPKTFDCETGRLAFEYVTSPATGWRVFDGTPRIADNTTLYDGQWSHWVVTQSETALVFYRNGSLVKSTTSGGVKLGGAMIIGARYSADTTFWKGALDDVLIFNRTLTQAEITQLYNWRQP